MSKAVQCTKESDVFAIIAAYNQTVIRSRQTRSTGSYNVCPLVQCTGPVEMIYAVLATRYAAERACRLFRKINRDGITIE